MKVIFTKVNPSEEIKIGRTKFKKKSHELLRKVKQNDFNYH